MIDLARSLRALILPVTAGLAFLLPACSGGGGAGNTTPPAFVGPNLSGHLVDGNGLPYPNATVSIDSAPLIATFSAEDGDFALEVPPGAHQLSVTIGGTLALVKAVSVPAGQKLDLGELQVTSTVRGTVVDGFGGPVSGALVEVGGTLSAHAVSGGNGAIELQLPTGSFVYVASWQGNEVPAQSFDVHLPALSSLGTIQVLVALQGTLVDGVLQPLAGAAVWIDSTPSVVTHTDEDGRFAAHVPVGQHPVRFELDGMLLFAQDLHMTGPAPLDLGSMQVLARVAGCVVDDVLQPVAGADIAVDTSPKTKATSDTEGEFELDLPFAALQLSVQLSGVVVQQMMLAPDASNAGAGVVAILPGTGVVQLPDVVANPQADSDGDGLGDALEVDGWTILVDELGDGSSIARHVYAHPGSVDVDGDALLDNEEFLVKCDPRNQDTDYDLLFDREELEKFKSNPVSVDTDGDARALDADGEPFGLPNPSLFDGYEYHLSHTSPTLFDTDGDGIRDYTEITEGGTSPLIADLPSIEIEVVGEPLVALNKEVGTTVESFGSLLQKASNTISKSFTHNLKLSLKYGSETKVSADLMIKKPYVKAAKVEGKVNIDAAINTDTTWKSSLVSSKELQSQVNEGQKLHETFDSGTIEAAVEVRNDSNVAVRFTDLEIVSFRVAPGANAYQPLGVLRDADQFGVGKKLDLGPHETALLVVRNEELNVGPVQQLVQSPTGLNLQIGNFTLKQIGEFGEELLDYDVINQNIVERTALLTIDRGDGVVERYVIATNVERNPDGSAAGINMGEALGGVLGEVYETEIDTEEIDEDDEGPYTFGKQVLKSIGGLEAEVALFPSEDESGEPIEVEGLIRFWLILGPGVVDELKNEVVDFDEITLMPGESYSLTYVLDEDNDKLFRNHEDFYGTSDHVADTDGDGLDDRTEVMEGWTVAFDDCDNCSYSAAELSSLTYTSYSHPRFVDFDDDGVMDGLERDAGTDPIAADTDGDDIPDGLDDCTGPGCGALPTQLLASALALDLETLLDLSPAIFFDVSGFGNNGQIGGPIHPVQFQDDPGVLQEGYYLFTDRHGDPLSALYVMNDDIDHVKVPCGLFGGQLCDQDLWGGGTEAKARMRIDREGQGAPALEANAPEGGEAGWSFSVWLTPKETGTTYVAYPVYEKKARQVVMAQKDFAELQILKGGTPVALIETGGSTLVASGSPNQVPGTKWTHLALTVRHTYPFDDPDGGSTVVTLYVDGAPQPLSAQTSGPISNTSPKGETDSEPIWIGWPYWNDSGDPFEECFNGALDDVRVYGKALLAEEVLELFEASKSSP